MNKFLSSTLVYKLTLSALFVVLLNLPAYAIKEETDYSKIYNDLPDIKAEFINNEDPDEYYDCRKFNISPYLLMRTSSTLYIKKIKIPPDYYLLTPREYNGKSAVLFKQKGKVLFWVPVYQKEEINPNLVYKIPPKPKTALWKKPFKFVIKKIKQLNHYENPPAFPKSKMDAFNLYEPFYEMDLYYENAVYKMIFKKNPY